MSTTLEKNILMDLELFNGVAEEHLDAISHFSERVIFEPRFNKPEVIFEKGTQADDLFFLVNGQLSLDIETGDHNAPGFTMPDTLYGELAWLLDIPRSATLEAKERCTFLKVDGNRFKAYLQENPDVGQHVYRVISTLLANRLYRINHQKSFEDEWAGIV